jgi:undecaprenyl-diphosphatase
MASSRQTKWQAVRAWWGAFDLIVLLVGVAVIVGAWAFVEIAEEVSEGETRSFDEAVVRALRNPADLADPYGPRWLEESVRDVTGLGGHAVLTLVTAAVVGYLVLARQFHAAILLVAAVVGAIVLSAALKGVHARPRPDLVPHLAYVSSASFPSGHAMLSATVYLTLGSLLARAVALLRMKLYVLLVGLTLTVLVGLSRIYLGVHYPTDVLAGWSVGLVWSLLCWLAGYYLQRRGIVEEPR